MASLDEAAQKNNNHTCIDMYYRCILFLSDGWRETIIIQGERQQIKSVGGKSIKWGMCAEIFVWPCPLSSIVVIMCVNCNQNGLHVILIDPSTT